MTRFVAAAAMTALGIAAGGFAKTHEKEAPVDPQKGANLASRIPCDGETNPEDQVTLTPMFSEGGLERSFRIQLYEDKYCKRGDLGWACVQSGKGLWKEEWSADSSQAAATGTLGLSSCYEQGSKDAPRYILTGWYREKGDPKTPWKQAEIKKAALRWETYEFTDPDGGTARLEIGRR